MIKNKYDKSWLVGKCIKHGTILVSKRGGDYQSCMEIECFHFIDRDRWFPGRYRHSDGIEIIQECDGKVPNN